MASMTEPRRIVSLVPSDTYTLARLGAGDRLVGRTEYCIAPDEVLRVPTVGGTKSADVDAIVALAPDLVIANQEENRKIDLERLDQAGVPVLLSFPCTVGEGLEHAERLAALFPSLDNGACLADARAAYERWARAARRAVPVFVPIWMDPLMTANGEAFLSDVVELCGGRNVFADRERRYPLAADLGRRRAVAAGERDTRYPRVTLAEVDARRPELVLLPDEPHEFTAADAAVFEALPCAPRVRFIDGKSLMWYGLRALEDLDRVAAWIAAASSPNSP
jgi:ABC-type Fe3+-hydroxamate transport system substrate-binding protein